jgi:hypothetical protein
MPATPTVVCTLRIDLITPATSGNGCIDKFKVWVDMAVSTPVPLSYVVLTCPITPVVEVPYFNSRGGYFPLPHLAPVIATLGPSFVAFDQVSNSGYAESAQYPAAHPIFEMWFHRDGVTDMTSPAFAALYPDVAGQEGIYHFTQATGYSFSLTSTYPNGNKDAFAQPVYATTTSNTMTLAVVDCETPVPPDPGNTCPCDWTLSESTCGTWLAPSIPGTEPEHWDDNPEIWAFTRTGEF